ncbi:MAG: hypothetical protein KF893_12965 [Caldilineaceae bacterium]|nr:hypothetical protein [Caldilineaceae bacterium]
MTIELQIRESVLAQALTEQVQTWLFTTCVPVNHAGLYVDHLDTIPGSLTFADAPGRGIDISLKVAIYVVSQVDVEAHPNGDPTGAQQPAGTVGVVVRLTIVNRALTIDSVTSDLSGLPLPPGLQSAVENAVDNAINQLSGQTLFDTTPIVSALVGADLPAEPDLARGHGVVAMRFGATGSLEPHLALNQDWGVFLDAGEAVDLLKRRMPNGLPINLRWQPNGSTPAILLDLNIDFEVLGLPVAGITVKATGSVSFLAPSTLKLSVSWVLDLGGVLVIFEAAAHKLAREEIRSRIPQAVHDGAQSFYFTINLPSIPAFLGAQPRWGGISSDAAGMTIGGPVKRAQAGRRDLIHISHWPFSRPAWWGHCRETETPPTHFDPRQLRVIAGVNLSDAGALCEVEILPPNQWLVTSKPPDQDGMGFDLMIAVAEQITADVRILLRTARGTRLVDLGKPIIIHRADEEGGGVDVQVNWIDDCLRLSGPWLKLITGEPLTPEDLVNPPIDGPDWSRNLGAELGLNSHLVTIEGLEQGEMVTLRGRGLQLDVIANENGHAIVPAVVGLSSDMSEVIVERVSRRPLTGAIRVQTIEFTRLAVVGPADAAAIRDVDGAAQIARQVGESVFVEVYQPDNVQLFARIEGHGEAALNLQPLPPQPPDAVRMATEAGLEDFAAVQTLPGSSEFNLALVQMRDGTGIIVTTDGRTSRIAGRYSGPQIGMQVDGGYAIAKSGDMIHLFAVHRPEDVTFNR